MDRINHRYVTNTSIAKTQKSSTVADTIVALLKQYAGSLAGVLLLGFSITAPAADIVVEDALLEVDLTPAQIFADRAIVDETLQPGAQIQNTSTRIDPNGIGLQEQGVSKHGQIALEDQLSEFGALENNDADTSVRDALAAGKKQPLKTNPAQNVDSEITVQAFSGDFNGDGCIDSISIQVNRINIFHPCNGRTTSYSFSGSFAINGTYNTDGQNGLEIGVVQSGYFRIIDDAEQRVRQYRFSGSYAINGNYNTDGAPGNEIGIVQSGYFRIIDDAEYRIRHYGFSGSYAINGNYNTDGTPGNEIGIVQSGYFRIIDDAEYRIRHYGIPGGYIITGVQNIDGQPGSEVLINNYTYNRNAIIYDRIYRITFY